MDEENFQFLTVKFDEVAKDKSLLSVTRMLAVDLQQRPYQSVGDFLKNLSDGDLDTLLDAADHEMSPHFADLLIITEMLASAEGVVSEYTDEDAMVERTRGRTLSLITYLAIESLARKGAVKAHRDNMSFGDDAGDKIVVERLE